MQGPALLRAGAETGLSQRASPYLQSHSLRARAQPRSDIRPPKRPSTPHTRAPRRNRGRSSGHGSSLGAQTGRPCAKAETAARPGATRPPVRGSPCLRGHADIYRALLRCIASRKQSPNQRFEPSPIRSRRVRIPHLDCCLDTDQRPIHKLEILGRDGNARGSTRRAPARRRFFPFRLPFSPGNVDARSPQYNSRGVMHLGGCGYLGGLFAPGLTPGF